MPRPSDFGLRFRQMMHLEYRREYYATARLSLTKMWNSRGLPPPHFC